MGSPHQGTPPAGPIGGDLRWGTPHQGTPCQVQWGDLRWGTPPSGYSLPGPTGGPEVGYPPAGPGWGTPPNLDLAGVPRPPNGVFTLHETENENDTDAENDKNEFHCNMQNTSHCTNTDNDLFNDTNGFQGHFFARFCTDNMQNTSCNAKSPVFCYFFFLFNVVC